MIIAIEVKKYMANIFIFCIIICEFYYKQEICLIILFLINKYLEVSFYYIILYLILAIYLKIKSCKKLLLDIKKLA